MTTPFNNPNLSTTPQNPIVHGRSRSVSDLSIDTPQLSLEQLDQRLTVVETLLTAQSQLASHSFASNGSLHMSDFLQSAQSSIMSGNQHSVTQPIGATNAERYSVNGSATTLLLPPPPYPPLIFTPPPQEGEGGKRRKTKKQKRQKKTKKRGNKGKRLTQRNRQ